MQKNMRMGSGCGTELIDTLWNVNAYTPLRFHSVMPN